MPLISQIGRRSLKVRLLIAAIYVVLLVGAVTMIYPFLLMLAGSTKSSLDTADARILPPFLVDDRALYAKHLEGLFNESLGSMKIAHDVDVSSFQQTAPPPVIHERLITEWRRFLAARPLPHYAYTLGYLMAPRSAGVQPERLRQFKAELIAEYGDDLAAMNQALGTQFVTWNGFYVDLEDYLQRRNSPGEGPWHRRYAKFKASQPIERRFYFSTEGFYKTEFLKNRYGRDITAYNQRHQTHYANWDEVHLDRTLPAGPGRTDLEREDWLLFVRSLLNLAWIRAEPSAAPAYHDFLKAKYGTIATLNRNYATRYAGFAEVPLVTELPDALLVRTDWAAFVEGWKDPDTAVVHLLPATSLRLESAEFLFRDFLRAQYGTVAGLNRALGTAVGDWAAVLPPQRELHYQAFQQDRAHLRREFLTRNYVSVWEYVARHGRAIVNTAIYCSLAILAALIVNPLAAYALSRYRPPSTYKMLLFLMLTMAFPPMVTQIPVFLMMREFHLLNSFWALLLPGLANGYAIFLLKGFFDSLPQELYESAQLDGAGEFRIFWQITMSLSTPILAVIGLGAFTGAYSNFMYALLICQDQRMWTLMPWLYQLQQGCGQGIIFASLIIASLPTFLVFALCQNVIMRGIVVPVEK